jgi:hypothetical protein
MQHPISIQDTPLVKAVEEAKKEAEKDGYKAEVIGIEKCYLAGYDETDTSMTEVGLVTCLDNDKRIYKVFTPLIRRARKDFNLKKPVWVIILRTNTGLELVAEIVEHTDQLELLFQQMKSNLGK